MSNDYLNRVWPLQLEPMEKFVLVALADRADDKGVCWPSVKDLEIRTGLSRRTIQRAISSVEHKGHVSRKIAPGKKCGYVIHPRQCDAPSRNDPRQCDAPPASEGHPTRATVTPHPRHSDAQTIIEPSDEPSDEPSEVANTAAETGPTPERVAEAWNKLAPLIGKPKVLKLTGARRKQVQARLREYGELEWRTLFEKLSRSAFLRGETGWHNATFDWVMKPANFQKILEGNYDRTNRPAAMDGAMYAAMERAGGQQIHDFEIPF